MERGGKVGNKLYESNQFEQKDVERVCSILEKIVSKGRIEKDDAIFIKKLRVLAFTCIWNRRVFAALHSAATPACQGYATIKRLSY